MKQLLLVVVVTITSVHAGLSASQKNIRLQEIEALQQVAPYVDVDAYKREIEYEGQDLSSTAKVKREAQLTAEKIKASLMEKYLLAQENLGAASARKEIESALENDLALVDPEFRSDLRSFTLEALDDIQNGDLQNSAASQKLERMLSRGVEERTNFFGGIKAMAPAPSMAADPPKVHFASRADVAQELINDGARMPYISSAYLEVEADDVSKRSGNITLQIKLEFMGTSINAGPFVTFTRTFTTKAIVLGEGMEPFLKEDGTFDIFIRQNGRQVMRGGQPAKRNMIFSCTAALSFQTEYGGQGGFTIAGSGANGTVSRTVSHQVTLNGRKIALPETVGGKYVSMKILSDVCSTEFMSARNSNQVSATSSLDTMMKNIATSLRLAHPKAQCTIDTHCYNWYNNLGLIRVNNEPRCILDEKTGEFAYCALRGKRGQTCALIENGRRVSTDQFEFVCDAGLSCVRVSDGGWFQEGIFGRVWAAPKGGCQ